jgi:hypothetical protein
MASKLSTREFNRRKKTAVRAEILKLVARPSIPNAKEKAEELEKRILLKAGLATEETENNQEVATTEE